MKKEYNEGFGKIMTEKILSKGWRRRNMDHIWLA
jgi:hypothetical protein